MRFKQFLYQELDSTNAEAQRLIKDGLNQSAAIISQYQLQGRGQKGNCWHSENGKNILISIVCFHNMPMENQFDISIKSSLGIIDFLDDYSIKAQIKWPNDILINGKKLAGILIENNVKGRFLSSSIIGIGLNVNQNSFPKELTQAISLNLITKQTHNLERDTKLLIEKVLNRLNTNYNQKSEYLNKLFGFKEYQKYLYKSEFISASIQDVLSTGELVLQKEDGSVITCVFKEIQLV
ncbi:MAG: biotin--[acetyl-CoA-carboxylase] ligase [Bacteroidales bacterium]|jgi:BirA family biotin operon repressor/biotin-[acetyl-CoA-carboxylase] ligase|nr:biotin--[acetyl-CoA-carboxylase] ligase [Bacteroidales bacterium]